MKTYKQWLSEAFTSPESKMAKKIKLKHGLLVLPRTHEAMKKYGCNTKWCLTYKTNDHWFRYVGIGKLTPHIFIVEKDYIDSIDTDIDREKYDLSKIAIMVDINNDVRHVWDARNENLSVIYGEDEVNYLLKSLGINKNDLKSKPIDIIKDPLDIKKEDYIEKLENTINFYIQEPQKYLEVLSDEKFFNIVVDALEKYYSIDYPNDITSYLDEDKIYSLIEEDKQRISYNILRKVTADLSRGLLSYRKAIIKDN